MLSQLNYVCRCFDYGQRTLGLGGILRPPLTEG
jgi:hypothetical protein